MEELRYVSICKEEIENREEMEDRPFYIRLLKSYKDLLKEYDNLTTEFDDELNYKGAEKDRLIAELMEKNKNLNKAVDIYRIKIAISKIMLSRTDSNMSLVNKIFKCESYQVLIRYIQRLKNQIYSTVQF